jgi:hypothetical protein
MGNMLRTACPPRVAVAETRLSVVPAEDNREEPERGSSSLLGKAVSRVGVGVKDQMTEPEEKRDAMLPRHHAVLNDSQKIRAESIVVSRLWRFAAAGCSCSHPMSWMVLASDEVCSVPLIPAAAWTCCKVVLDVDMDMDMDSGAERRSTAHEFYVMEEVKAR